MTEEASFTIQLDHQSDYAFTVNFNLSNVAQLVLDEPPPLGRQAGPNASHLVAAAVANCLSASLLFCLSKHKVTANSLTVEATCKLLRNDRQRLRLGGIDVRITLNNEAFNKTSASREKRCLELFEDFCVVTESLRNGIQVDVSILDNDGHLLYPML
ncbi:MAG: OsmC family protein [Gammaproteobacteria bacterium]|nr:OsmC family protein [Gammaproteobacteria bacterium]